ncbi:hypothetical protein PO883_26810 [Massilia sp. DJPM01]|uniref:DUF7832 domain-containing protein n=1 Tax=Massilia sp. DJPM01 TaxID=3024404 RepID=UPI00259D56A7|nr:hypothetical protein [Massilia sp. DJPM01]MDM5180800.1 hypothetical protein [Massilia sp. DJPM01]
MDFDVAAWEQEIGRPVPPLMAKFFTWLAPYEYGDLGYFELAPENLAGGTAWEGMERWGADTWGFISLPDGSLIGLCEAVQPPAVVHIGSEGELRTLAESFEAFLLAIDAGETETEIDLADDDLEPEQVAARKAFTSWLNKSKIAAPAVSGQFDFSAYAAGDPPERRAPPTQQGAAPALDPAYLDHIDGMGERLRMLCSLVGRTAADPELCAVAGQVFGKAPPQSVGNAKHDDSIWLTAKKADVSFLFSRKVLNPNYAPVPIGNKAICPFLESVFLGDAYSEPVLFGLHGDALWDAIALKLPQLYKETVDEDGELEKACTVPLDAARDTELRLWMNNGRTNACVQIAQGRELAWPEAANQVHSGAGLFLQWALENGWLERGMFPGQDELIDAMRRREARPSQLVRLGLTRGLWDTHLADEPGLRQFAYVYFHNMDGIWINADLKTMFGKRQGQYGHDEPVLDDDPAEICDALFAVFSTQFAGWKKANPQELA